MPAPLSPPETSEQRKARQYSVLHHLGIMAHDLACDAHARAKQQLAPPSVPKPPRPPSDHQTDFAATFASLSRAVRQAIALEIRLDAPPHPRLAYRNAAPLPDPRRTPLRRVFHDAVAKDPDRARRRREIDERIEQELQADPDQTTPLEATVVALCNGLHIDLDLSRVPDALLGMPPRPHPTPS